MWFDRFPKFWRVLLSLVALLNIGVFLGAAVVEYAFAGIGDCLDESGAVGACDNTEGKVTAAGLLFVGSIIGYVGFAAPVRRSQSRVLLFICCLSTAAMLFAVIDDSWFRIVEWPWPVGRWIVGLGTFFFGSQAVGQWRLTKGHTKREKVKTVRA